MSNSILNLDTKDIKEKKEIEMPEKDMRKRFIDEPGLKF